MIDAVSSGSGQYPNLSQKAEPVKFKGANSQYNRQRNSSKPPLPLPVPNQIPPHMQNAIVAQRDRNSIGGSQKNQSNSFGNQSTSVSNANRQNSANSGKLSYLSGTMSTQQKVSNQQILKHRPKQSQNRNTHTGASKDGISAFSRQDSVNTNNLSNTSPFNMGQYSASAATNFHQPPAHHDFH